MLRHAYDPGTPIVARLVTALAVASAARVGDGAMSMTCTVCRHPERAAIEQALIAGDAIRDVARQFALSKDAVMRHKAGHLPVKLVKAQDAKEASQADDLLKEVRLLRGKAVALLLKAEQEGDYRTALQGIREARGCLELLAKLLDAIHDGPTINILISPEWAEVRTVLLTTLAPYPDARQAVAGALAELDRGAA